MRCSRLLLSLFAPVVSLTLACGGPPEPAAAKAPESAPPPPVPTSEAPKAMAETPKSAEPAAGADAPLAAVAPTVKLLDAGAAPKKVLRYKFKAGASEYVEMDMKMAMALTTSDKHLPRVELPTVRATMRIDAKEVTPEGNLHCTFTADRVDVLKDATLDAKLRENLEKQMAEIVGMHGKALVSARGVVDDAELELAPGASSTLKGQLDSLRDAIRNLYAPFPEEEVGKGAKWEVSARIPISGAMADTKMLFTLTKLDDKGAETDVVTKLEAPTNQRMVVPALPPGSTATLESLSGSGSGKIAPSFIHLVGTGTNKISTETAFEVAMQGQKLAMKMQSDIVMSVRPGKAPAPPAPKPK